MSILNLDELCKDCLVAPACKEHCVNIAKVVRDVVDLVKKITKDNHGFAKWIMRNLKENKVCPVCGHNVCKEYISFNVFQCQKCYTTIYITTTTFTPYMKYDRKDMQEEHMICPETDFHDLFYKLNKIIENGELGEEVSKLTREYCDHEGDGELEHP